MRVGVVITNEEDAALSVLSSTTTLAVSLVVWNTLITEIEASVVLALLGAYTSKSMISKDNFWWGFGFGFRLV